MNRPILTAAAIVMLLWACGDRQEPTSQEQVTATATDSTEKVESPYFPVYDFIRNEVEYVDSLPVGIMKFTTRGKKTDSGFIKLEEFHTLAGEFLAPELYDSAFKKLFKESSFFDRTSNNSTFFYKTDDESSPIRRVDVITEKGEVYDEVKSVYVERHTQSGDSVFVKKMQWKPKRNFHITTIRSLGEKSAGEQIKVVWDNRE